jgi:hypothetical protein
MADNDPAAEQACLAQRAEEEAEAAEAVDAVPEVLPLAAEPAEAKSTAAQEQGVAEPEQCPLPAVAQAVPTVAPVLPAAAPAAPAVVASERAPSVHPDTKALQELRTRLLQVPRQTEVDRTLQSVQRDVSTAAYYQSLQLLQVPAVVRLAIEVEVRRSDWLRLSALQQQACSNKRESDAHTWQRYEHHLMESLKALIQALPQVGRTLCLLSDLPSTARNVT